MCNFGQEHSGTSDEEHFGSFLWLQTCIVVLEHSGTAFLVLVCTVDYQHSDIPAFVPVLEHLCMFLLGCSYTAVLEQYGIVLLQHLNTVVLEHFGTAVLESLYIAGMGQTDILVFVPVLEH